jgi:2-iminobutanoate/2-iminopropanoate deaminase
MKKNISTDVAPAAIGPYAQAIVAGPFVYCSGQIALDPATGALDPAQAVEQQAERALRNLEAVLTAAGAELQQVIKTTLFLTSMDDFAAVNEVYARYFPRQPPARSTVAVAGLPRGAKVEIEAVAWIAE